MKIVFAGTPDVALPTLRAIVDSDHHIVAVVTRPDAPLGRKAILTPSPVAQFAESLNLNVIKTKSVDSAIQKAIEDLAPDLGVVVAFGAFLPDDTLAIPKHGWINLHFSKLPELRGAAPVQWTLLNGSTHAHTTVFQLVKEMDAGPIASIESVSLNGSETSTQLLETLAQLGSRQTLTVIDHIAEQTQSFTEQTGEPTFAPKLDISHGYLDPALELSDLFNRYRGVTAEPGAWIMDGDTRVKVHEADKSIERIGPGTIELLNGRVLYGTASQALRLIAVQPAGKAKMSAADWARGRR